MALILCAISLAIFSAQLFKIDFQVQIYTVERNSFPNTDSPTAVHCAVQPWPEKTIFVYTLEVRLHWKYDLTAVRLEISPQLENKATILETPKSCLYFYFKNTQDEKIFNVY